MQIHWLPEPSVNVEYMHEVEASLKRSYRCDFAEKKVGLFDSAMYDLFLNICSSEHLKINLCNNNSNNHPIM